MSATIQPSPRHPTALYIRYTGYVGGFCDPIQELFTLREFRELVETQLDRIPRCQRHRQRISTLVELTGARFEHVTIARFTRRILRARRRADSE
jgi:hypothetical protein